MRENEQYTRSACRDENIETYWLLMSFQLKIFLYGMSCNGSLQITVFIALSKISPFRICVFLVLPSIHWNTLSSLVSALSCFLCLQYIIQVLHFLGRNVSCLLKILFIFDSKSLFKILFTLRKNVLAAHIRHLTQDIFWQQELI